MKESQSANNAYDIIELLKACAALKDVQKGFKVHAYIRNHAIFEKNSYIGGALVNMYAKCGALSKAEQVFKELSVQNVITWNAIIAAYAQQGKGEEALRCFDNMQHEGYSPDVATFICALKSCGSIGAAVKGEQIHNKIAVLDMLEKNVMLGSTLVDMYGRCGANAKALQVIEELPVRNVVSWNVLIAGYAQHGQGGEALRCFDCMQFEGQSPDAATFACALKACGSIGGTAKGEQMHEKIVSLGMLEKNVVLGSSLVDMYAKCGALEKAHQVLAGLSVRNVVTWNALLGGYAQLGQGKEALKCFDSMQHEGHSPDAVTFASVLNACGNAGAIAKGGQIHSKIVSLSLLDKNIVLGNILVDMYARCGAPAKAQQVLEGLHLHNVVTWNVLIAGYVQQGKGDEALKCFESMQYEGHSPNVVTFTYVLNACESIGATAKGEQIHDRVSSLGTLKKNMELGNALVDMYARCGALEKAQQVFRGLPDQNVVTWNALIAGYVEQGLGEEALKCFYHMQFEGLFPDLLTFTCGLKACLVIAAATEGEQIHDIVVNLGLEKDALLRNTLVHMYVKCGALVEGQQVLEGLHLGNVDTWNTLIAAYAKQGQWEETLRCFDHLQQQGCSPDAVTFTCALKACGNMGVFGKGKQIHENLARMGMLEKNTSIGNILVDMYARCGALVMALEVFEELPLLNVVTWNALIGGYAQQGQCFESLTCFERMQFDEMKPDSITLISVLNACSHSGIWNQAEVLFSKMNTNYGIIPDAQHCCCMVDLFGRAGRFNNALAVIEKMPFAEYPSVWVTLLCACRTWGERNIGMLAFENALHLDESDAVIFLYSQHLFSNWHEAMMSHGE